jgi:hypothetical protein
MPDRHPIDGDGFVPGGHWVSQYREPQGMRGQDADQAYFLSTERYRTELVGGHENVTQARQKGGITSADRWPKAWVEGGRVGRVGAEGHT